MITRITIVAAFAALFATGCMKNNSAGSGMNATADSMRAAYKAVASAWDAGKTNSLDQYVATNMVEHNPMPGQQPGLAGFKQMITEMKAGFPDEKTTIEDIRVDSNMLIARVRMSGTNSGPMMGMPPTNKKMTDVMGIDMIRWENGKFVEHWGLFDDHAMMSQLGLMPPPGGPPTADAEMPKDQKKM
jgi:predicted ester cyclase